MQKLYTIPELAEYFKVSGNTVYRWIYAGLLPALKLGKRTIRITEQDLDKFMQRYR